MGISRSAPKWLLVGMAVSFMITTGIGCANLSSLQTARVMEKNKGEITAGAGFVTFPDFSSTSSTATIALPYFEGGIRYGLGNNFEIGGKVTLIGTINLDAKYQLIDAGEFALSVGGGVGYFGLSSNNTSVTIIDLLAPVILSYDFSPMFAAYASPKFNYRLVSGSSSANDYGIFGTTVGFKIGNTGGVYIEGTYGVPLENNIESQIQGDIALFFHFGKGAKKAPADEGEEKAKSK